MSYLINDIARLLGVSTNTLRKYEKEGFLTPKRGHSNYRQYDEQELTKISLVRMYIKCGFSYAEIRQMIGKDSDEIAQIYYSKLDILDRELLRLKRMRHWLKDNASMINTMKDIGSGFYFMNCPAVRYIFYGVDNLAYKDRERLGILKRFIYEVPEIQLIRVYKYDDVMKSELTAYKGWAVKEMDIEKYGLMGLMNEGGDYIRIYPETSCLYCVLEMKEEYAAGGVAEEMHREHIDRINGFLEKNALRLNGDIMQFVVTALGSSTEILTCVPIASL